MVPRPHCPAPRRGAITGFSGAARKRLIELMASLNRQRLRRLPLFVTLTYPAKWPDEPQVWKRHLDTWLKRLEREYTGLSVIWKLEFQSRGAPHYHLLVFGARWISPQWLSRSWYEVVDSGDINHLMAGTKVEFIRSWRGVMFYASKYLAKKTNEGLMPGVGRFWGVMHRERLPMDLMDLPLTFGQFFRLRRLLLHWTQVQGRKRQERDRKPDTGRRRRVRSENQGLTVFTDYERVLQLLRYLAG